jgi:hypothetical protein
VFDIEKYIKATGDADGKSYNIDEIIAFLSREISESDFKIVSDHDNAPHKFVRYEG